MPEPADLTGRSGTDYTVLGVASVVVLGILSWGLIGGANLHSTSSSILTWLVTNLGWLFILTATGFVLFTLWLAFSRFGKIPLGKDG